MALPIQPDKLARENATLRARIFELEAALQDANSEREKAQLLQQEVSDLHNRVSQGYAFCVRFLQFRV